MKIKDNPAEVKYKLNRITKKRKSFIKKDSLKKIFPQYSIGDQIIEILNHAIAVLQNDNIRDVLFFETKKTAIEDMLTIDTLLKQFEKSIIKDQKKEIKKEKFNV